MDIHKDRKRAESFGAVARDYEAFRPKYPEALIATIYEAGKVVASSADDNESLSDRTGSVSPADGGTRPRILDVGAGTGILSAQLEAAGAEVLTVEPDPEMAAIAKSKGLNVEVSAFEEWDPHARTFDLVTFGQSFHWIDPAVALPLIRTILHPYGKLALAWNDVEATGELGQELSTISQRFQCDGTAVSFGTKHDDRAAPADPDTSTDADATNRDSAAPDSAAAPTTVEHPALSNLRENDFTTVELSFDEDLRYTRQAWLSMVFTYSAQLTMEHERREAMRRQMSAVIPAAGVQAHNEALLILAAPAHSSSI